MKIEIKILNKEFYRVDKTGGSYYDTPQYQTEGSAGVDLRCTEDVTIYPGETKMISTGLAIWIGGANHTELGEITYKIYGGGVAGLILPRSGLGTKGLVLGNTMGVIDEDYQGELIIAAWNRDTPTRWFRGSKIEKPPLELKAGDRIAQLIFVPVIKASWQIVDEFSNSTDRGEGGFGHTG